MIRGSILLLTPGALETDPDGYRRLAENLINHGTFGIKKQSPLPLGEGQGEGTSARAENEGEGTKNKAVSVHPFHAALTLPLSQRERELTPTAYRPPFYPLMLCGCVVLGEHSRIAIGALHVIFGVATVGLTWLLGRWWGLGNRGAAIAAFLVACDPILLNQSTQVMTETPAAFLVVAGLVILTGASRCPTVGRMILAGIVLALGALCRPTLLLWTILVGAVLVFYNRQPTGSVGSTQKLRWPTAFLLGAALVLCPWAIRNQIQFGRPIVTTTHGGYTFLLANNPEFYEWLRSGRWGDTWQADPFNAAWEQRRPRNELQADRLAYAEAFQTIRREPGTFAYACLVRSGRFWSPLPHQVTPNETASRRLSRYAVAGWYVVEFALVVLAMIGRLPRGHENSGEWRVEGGGRKAEVGTSDPSSIHHSAFSIHRSPTWLWGLLLVACLTAVHVVFWTDMRMRAPLMPIVSLAAAVLPGTSSFRGKTVLEL